MEILGFSMVISVISEVISVISVDFGDFGESCYPQCPPDHEAAD